MHERGRWMTRQKWNAEKYLSLMAYPRNTAGGSTASLCCVFLASVSTIFLRVFIALDGHERHKEG